MVGRGCTLGFCGCQCTGSLCRAAMLASLKVGCRQLHKGGLIEWPHVWGLWVVGGGAAPLAGAAAPGRAEADLVSVSSLVTCRGSWNDCRIRLQR